MPKPPTHQAESPPFSVTKPALFLLSCDHIPNSDLLGNMLLCKTTLTTLSHFHQGALKCTTFIVTFFPFSLDAITFYSALVSFKVAQVMGSYFQNVALVMGSNQ